MEDQIKILYEFTDEFLHSLFLKTQNVPYYEPLPEDFDLGLRKMLSAEPVILSAAGGLEHSTAQNSFIYYLSDEYECSYILLPDHENESRIFLIGPYVTEVPEINKVRKMCRVHHISSDFILPLMQYYSSMPCIADEGILQSYIEILARRIKGDGAVIRHLRLTGEQKDYSAAVKQSSTIGQENLEKRYQNETLMMERIAAGDTSGALKELSRITRTGMDVRSSDSISSQHYYLAVMNALCRKAAEKGGVHPYYLDEISREMSVKILKTYNMETLDRMPAEILAGYCRCVAELNVSGYSNTVSRALNYINANLDSQKLSLAAVADELNVSRSYLSARFKEELHQTLTDYTAKRRIENAKELLRDTSLPVQDIASLSGIDDAAYFTRMFKMKTGMTPRQYRKISEKKQ